MDKWDIGLSSWIIQDGNYPDFVRGQIAEFALEFYPSEIQITEQAMYYAKPLGDARYQVCAEVTYIAEDWWVVDFGVPAFQHNKPPSGISVGAFITGEIWLGIDYYIYFEFLAHRSGAPKLIYSWRIERISMQLSRTVQSFGASGELVLTTRDDSELVWQDVKHTDAWRDDEGHASYILHCLKLDLPPKQESATAIPLPEAGQIEDRHENHNP